jgi:transporter family protein
VHWLLWSGLAIVSWGVWGVVAKLAMTRLSWARVALAYYTVALPIALVVLLVRALDSPWPARGVLYAVLTGATGMVGLITFYKSLELAKASLVVPLTGIFPVVTAVLALVFLDEGISMTQGIGIACATVAVVLISRS